MMPGTFDERRAGGDDRIASGRAPSAAQTSPDPELERVDVPDRVRVGDAVTITVTARNVGGDGGPYSTITTSFPALDDTDDDRHVEIRSHDFVGGYKLVGTAGDTIWTDDDQETTARYALAEAGTGEAKPWPAGRRHSLSVTVTPQSTGPFPVNIRATLTAPNDVHRKYTAPESSTTDQQGYPVKQTTVEVTRETVTTEPPTPEITPTREYDLAAGTKREIDLGWTQVYVITDIPGAHPERRAVTKTDLSLVDRQTTYDALWTESYTRQPDARAGLRARLEQAQHRRDQLKIREFLARAAEIGLNILEAYALVKLTPGNTRDKAIAATGTVIDALTDSIAWAQSENLGVYEREFTRMTDAAHNLVWVDLETANIRSRADFEGATEQLLDTTAEVFDQMKTGYDLGQAWGTLLRGLTKEPSPASGLFYKGVVNQVDDMAKGMAIGLAVTKAVNDAEHWFRMNAKIAGLLHAYHTARIPMLRDVIELEKKAQNAALPPKDIPRYHVYRFTLNQMGALAYGTTAEFHRAMAEETEVGVSEVLELLQGVRERAKRHSNVAESKRRQAKWDFLGLGAGQTDAQRALATSINADVLADRGGGA